MKNVVTRSISGAVYVAVLVGAILAGGGWLLALLLFLGLTATGEFLAMANAGQKSHRICNLYDYVANLSLIAASYFHFSPAGGPVKVFVAIAACAVIARFIAQLYAVGGNAIHSLAAAVMSYVYIGVSLAIWPMLYYSLATPHLLLALLIFIWINDTGAFCVGSLLGRHKLWERISPKKSWEGFFGGMFFCVAGAFVMHFLFPSYYGGAITLGTMCRLGLLACVFATYGDLIESIIKRTAGVKDSGNLIPGHGGILDRIDSLLLVIPAAAVYIFLW